MNLKKLFSVHLSKELARDLPIWISILLAVTLINLPNLVSCFIPSFSWLGVKLWLFSTSLTLLLCTFGMRVRLMLWLALPFVLLVPACLVSLIYLHNLPTTFLLLALLETNTVELTALQTQVTYIALGTLLLAALYAWFVKNRVPAHFRLGPAGRAVILLTLLIPPLSDLLSHGGAPSLAGIKQRCLSTFPCSTLYASYEAFDMRSRVENRKTVTEQLAISQEPGFRDEQQRQVHMLVIGESATKSCFGLYGYDRETTPLLERTPGLMPFRDVASTATFTLVAVPALLTPTPTGQVLKATQEASLLSAYKKAGFRIYWLSAQRKHGTFDTVTSIFSGDADESVFKGGAFDADGGGAYEGASDVSLLPWVRSILKREEPKVLFVLHTIGSHGPYTSRYPSQLARFPADPQAVQKSMGRIADGTSSDPQDLEIVQNSYDNTICATDFLLANLINDLKKLHASSWLCYVSDHGENTSKAPFGKFMHGLVSRQIVEVPMLMWVSPLYEQAHAAKVAGLKSHLSTPFSASCTFHTLLDMGGLSCASFKPEWSAASPLFAPGPRLVCDSRGILVDYDQKFPARQETAQAPQPPTADKIRTLAAGLQRP
ncbi:MAG: phosphoethanolamine transferase [Verrucomicrobia bacterium]|nr:phosphoethanolamine transferase [Verrucomicrobiota bacterium]